MLLSTSSSIKSVTYIYSVTQQLPMFACHCFYADFFIFSSHSRREYWAGAPFISSIISASWSSSTRPKSVRRTDSSAVWYQHSCTIFASDSAWPAVTGLWGIVKGACRRCTGSAASRSVTTSSRFSRTHIPSSHTPDDTSRCFLCQFPCKWFSWGGRSIYNGEWCPERCESSC